MNTSQFNRESMKDQQCPDCGGMLQATYYGCKCCDCGQLFNDKMEHAKQSDLF